MGLTTPPRPHDLVRLSPDQQAAVASGAPPWVRASLARACWAVVRNGHVAGGSLPVGIRGTTRNQRWAATVEWPAVVAVRSPESLRHGTRLPGVAALRALSALAACLDRDWACWGPTGGVGFSLATGWVTVTAASDLDLLLRCPVRPARASLDVLAGLFREQESRIDCQVETPAGLVHLDDLRRDGPSLMRTPEGPRLRPDPWRRGTG